MARVFISHSSRDNEPAERIKAWLGERGFDTPFLDFDKHAGIPPGADWERTLYTELDRCEAMVIVQTPSWLDSKWCFAEFTQARALGKPIFPVIVTPTGDTLISPDIQALNLLQDREGGLDQLARELTQIALDSHGGFDWDNTRAPYPGLLAFQEEDAPIYFGRDDDIRRLIERLNMRRTHGGSRLIALLGASGSGKSSLMRAGVIPRLRRAKREWIIAPPIRPQARPLDEFIRSLAIASNRDWRSLRNALEGEDCGWVLEDIASDLRMKAGANEAQILLPIDQAEEVFTGSNPEEAAHFLRVLSTALSDNRPYLAVMAMRSDFLGELQSAEHLTARFEEFSLGPMPLARIPQIIEGPARVAGVTVEDAFVHQAARDAETEDALPLLAFALREIHDGAGGDNHLSLSDYQAFGDAKAGLTPLENAVRRAADAVIDEAQPDEATLKALRDAFVPAMVRINDHGDYVRRPARWSDLPMQAHDLLDRLAKARLLVVRQEEDERIVEVAHEALLRKWPRLRDWLDEAKQFLAGRQQLEIDLRDWGMAAEAQKPAALLSGLKLDRARGWLSERPHQLSDPERIFIGASIDRAEAEARRRQEEQERRVRDAEALAEANRKTAKRTRIGLVVASVLALLSMGAGVLAYTQLLEADSQRANAERLRADSELRQSQLLASFAAEENRQENHTNAVLLSLAALDTVSPQQRDELVEAKSQLYAGIANLRETRVMDYHRDKVTFATFNHDGTRLVTVSHDASAVVWDMATDQPLFDLSGAEKRVTHAAFSPDGRVLATASFDRKIRLWDMTDGTLLHELLGSDGEYDEAYHVDFSPDSRRVVAAITSKAVMWDVATGNRIADMEGYADPDNMMDWNYVVHARFSADGTRIITSDRVDGTALLWDGKTGAFVADLAGHEAGNYYVTFSPDSQRALSAAADGTARIWDARNGEAIAVLEGHSGNVFHADYNSNGSLIVTVAGDRTARIWSAADGRSLLELRGHEDQVRHAAFIPAVDGMPERVVTVGRDNLAIIWDAQTGERLGRFVGHLDDVTHVALSPDGRMAATTGDTSIRLWHLQNDDYITVLEGHSGSVDRVVFSADGARLLSSPSGYYYDDSFNQRAILWDTQTGDAITSFEGTQVRDAAISPDEQWIAVASRNSVLLANASTGDIIREMQDAQGDYISVAFSRDSEAIVASFRQPGTQSTGIQAWEVTTGQSGGILEDNSGLSGRLSVSPDSTKFMLGSVSLWDAQIGEYIGLLPRSAYSATRTTPFSPDSQLILTTDGDGTALIWDASGTTQIRSLSGHSGAILSAVFSADGTRILTTSADRTARVWDVETGAALLVLEGHKDQVNFGAFSPDGRLIATGAGTQSFMGTRRVAESFDNSVLVWDAQTGEPLSRLDGHDLQVRHLAFNADSTQLATASEDGNVRLWRLFPGTDALIDHAQAVIPRGLSPEELEGYGLAD